MAQLVCPRCQRVNPGEAHYCYFDGFSLRQGVGPPSSPASEQLPQHFAFPSGRRCRSFDELVHGCQLEWEAARTLLQDGEFTRYFGLIGRADYAHAAEEAKSQPDPDIALYNFVSQMPAIEGQGPRLDLNPRRLIIGKVRAGEQRQVRLTVSNQGKGLLQGRVSVTDGGDWLKIVDGADESHFPVRTGREQAIALRVETRGLACGNSYSAKLTAITNGGIAEVPVRVDLLAAPFSKPPFQGAATARELAAKMRVNPKAAVPMLESGEIAQWFRQNGWTYPVTGTAAKGVAAVQQFFEGMGLSKPPPLELSEQELNFTATDSEAFEGQVTLRTNVKKWVYGNVESDVDWLTILTPNVNGPQQAAILFEVDASQVEAAGSHKGNVTVTANAGQKLTVRVLVDIRQPHKPILQRFWQPLVRVALLLLLLRLLLIVPADLSGRLLLSPPRADAPRGSLAFWKTAATTDESFLRHFVLATWWVGPIVGVGWVWRRGGLFTDLLCGLLAGAGGGLLAAATAGCAMDYLDAAPRLLLDDLPADLSPWVVTPLWLVLVLVWWGIVGFVLAFPLAWLCKLLGLQRLAGLLGL